MEIKTKFFSKHHFLLGINMMDCETMETSTGITYDSVHIELGIGIMMITFVLNFKKKGSN